MKNANIIILCALVTGCNGAKTYKAGDDPIQACEDIAKAAEKLLGDNGESAAAYRSALDDCQIRIGDKVTDVGAEYANCVLKAESGSAVRACHKDSEQNFLDEKTKVIEELSVELWKEICKGGDEEDDPRLKEITRIENEARALGFSQADTNAMLERVREKSGCDM